MVLQAMGHHKNTENNSMRGPIRPFLSGILGLGAGTIARMINAHYPTRPMSGWELDPAVVMAARLYMGMDEVEATGQLTCHTGDALDPGAMVEGGFSGMLVDLFANGSLLPQLTQARSGRLSCTLASLPVAYLS